MHLPGRVYSGRIPLTSDTAPWVKEVMLSGSTDDLESVRGGPRWTYLYQSAPLRTDALANSWLRCLLYAFPSILLIMPPFQRVRLSDHRVLLVILLTPQFVGWAALAAPSKAGPPVSAGGEGLPSISRPPSALDMATGGGWSRLADLKPSVSKTLQSARTPSDRMVYGNCWTVFSVWCRDKGLDPVICPMQDTLRYL